MLLTKLPVLILSETVKCLDSFNIKSWSLIVFGLVKDFSSNIIFELVIYILITILIRTKKTPYTVDWVIFTLEIPRPE